MNPVRPTVKSEWFPVLLIILSVALGFYFYANFPNVVPSHWGISGQVDGYSSKAFGAWFVPGLLVAIYLLFIFIPFIDPKKNHYEHFKKAYHGIKNLMVAFLFVLYIFIGLAGLGVDIPVGNLVPVGVGLLFIGLGYFIKSVEQNWALGVRTPWTMESPVVWKKTNQLMARLMLLGGVLIALCAFPIDDIYKACLFILALIIIAIVPIVYSYFAYQKEQKAKK